MRLLFDQETLMRNHDVQLIRDTSRRVFVEAAQKFGQSLSDTLKAFIDEFKIDEEITERCSRILEEMRLALWRLLLTDERASTWLQAASLKCVQRARSSFRYRKKLSRLCYSLGRQIEIFRRKLKMTILEQLEKNSMSAKSAKMVNEELLL